MRLPANRRMEVMTMTDFRFGVVVFPGTNCEQDVVAACRHLGYRADYIWHQETSLSGFDAVILPGGASFGSYLRSGAIASLSPVMEAVADLAALGRPVLGICDGFQILCEAGLLPGVLMRNRGLKHITQSVQLRVEASVCQWLDLPAGTLIELPISHSDGRYFCDELTLGRLVAKGQVVLRYCQPDGSSPATGSAPNGALDDIAGITNERGNVFGLMPHPERVTDGLSGSQGSVFFQSIVQRLEAVV